MCVCVCVCMCVYCGSMKLELRKVFTWLTSARQCRI